MILVGFARRAASIEQAAERQHARPLLVLTGTEDRFRHRIAERPPLGRSAEARRPLAPSQGP